MKQALLSSFWGTVGVPAFSAANLPHATVNPGFSSGYRTLQPASAFSKGSGVYESLPYFLGTGSSRPSSGTAGALSQASHSLTRLPRNGSLSTLSSDFWGTVNNAKASANEALSPTLESNAYKSVLKKRPFRYLGFMNETAQAIGKKMLGPLYSGMWLGEYVYMSADSFIDARHQYKQHPEASRQSKVSLSGREFLNTAAFQALATVFVPTWIIDQAKQLTEVAVNKLPSGVLGLSKHTSEKWVPVGVGLSLIPPLTYVVDPAIEWLTNKTVRPLLHLASASDS